MSVDPYNRNFTLGHADGQFEVRLRTTTNGNNGTNVRLYSGSGSATTALSHIVFTRDSSGAAALYIDGVLLDTATIGGNFSNWDPSYDFGLANEFSTPGSDSNRNWLGEYRLVAVYSRALSAAEVQQNFTAGGQ